MSSLVKCLFVSFVYILIALFVFLLLSVESSLSVLDMPFVRYVVCKYFLPVYNLSVILLILAFTLASQRKSL